MISSAFALRAWPGVDWGDVSGWFNGAGALLAALAAVGIAIYDNRRHATELGRSAKAAEDRARRRALRVTVIAQNSYTRAYFDDSDAVRECKIFFRNSGDADVYDVQWYRPLVVYYQGGEAVGSGWGSMAATVFESYSGRQYRRIEDFSVPVLPKTQNGDLHFTVRARSFSSGPVYRLSTFALVSFVDLDGFRLGWIYERSRPEVPILEDPTLKGRWEVVGDDYPASAGGAWAELVSLIEPDRHPDLLTPNDNGYRGSESFAEYRGPRPGDREWNNRIKPEILS